MAPIQNGAVFLEVFAGCASLAKAAVNMGFHSVAIDKTFGSGGDLWDDVVYAKLLESVGSGPVRWVHFGIPCETWSRARRFDGHGPPPLRDDEECLWGLPREDLGEVDRRKLADANRLTRRALEVARAASRRGKTRR